MLPSIELIKCRGLFSVFECCIRMICSRCFSRLLFYADDKFYVFNFSRQIWKLGNFSETLQTDEMESKDKESKNKKNASQNSFDFSSIMGRLIVH